jgi:hypothetical protein
MQIFVGRLRMASTHLVFKVSGVYISNLGKKFEIFTSSNLFSVEFQQHSLSSINHNS